MTTYRIHGIAVEDDAPTVYLVVGKRDRLEPIHLTRAEAWKLLESLTTSLRRTEVSA